MAKFAQFKIGTSPDAFEYVEFTPSDRDVMARNYADKKCFYRSGAWYVASGEGMPRVAKDGPTMGIPGVSVQPCAFPACACSQDTHCASSVQPAGPVEVVPVPAGDKSHAPSAYPDGNPKSLQGAKKFDLMYLPLPAKIEVCRALEDGARKYGKANWRLTGVSASVYLNAAMRHIYQFNEGQERASDSGVHNLGHAMACLAIIIDAAANGKLIDDRPEACVDTDALLKR